MHRRYPPSRSTRRRLHRRRRFRRHRCNVPRKPRRRSTLPIPLQPRPRSRCPPLRIRLPAPPANPTRAPVARCAGRSYRGGRIARNRPVRPPTTHGAATRCTRRPTRSRRTSTREIRTDACRPAMRERDPRCVDTGLDTTANGASVSDPTQRRSSYVTGIAPRSAKTVRRAAHHGRPTDTLAYDPVVAPGAAESATRATGRVESRPSACMHRSITMSVPTAPYTAWSTSGSRCRRT